MACTTAGGRDIYTFCVEESAGDQFNFHFGYPGDAVICVGFHMPPSNPRRKVKPGQIPFLLQLALPLRNMARQLGREKS